MTSMKPKKIPQGTPELGHACCLRKDERATGLLLAYNPKTEWARVKWDAGVSGPKICHRFELLRIDWREPLIRARNEQIEAKDTK